MVRIFISLFVFVGSLLIPMTSSAVGRVEVKVGGYVFSPFVEEGYSSGLSLQMIRKLNTIQKKYHFAFQPTSAKRRYLDFKNKRFDLIMFEDEAWGWKPDQFEYAATNELMKAKEVFVGLKLAGRNQDYFAELKGKRIRGILGYHYNFAEMKTESTYLEKLGVILTESHSDNLKAVLTGKADLMICNDLWLQEEFRKDPQLKEKVFVSDRPDQTYSLRALVGAGSPISASDLNQLIIKVQRGS